MAEDRHAAKRGDEGALERVGDPRRQTLMPMAAFDNLGQIRRSVPPLYLHPLTKAQKGQRVGSGEFVIKLQGDDGITFRPTGAYTKLPSGTPDINTVTHIEITLIGNHRGRSQ